jgi:hypothetical protein
VSTLKSALSVKSPTISGALASKPTLHRQVGQHPIPAALLTVEPATVELGVAAALIWWETPF